MRKIPGTSEQKYIVDENEHDKLFPEYLKVLDELQKICPVSKNEEFSKLVNFEKNKELPLHRWFYYKQGYSDELVKKLIFDSNKITSNDYILDPFCGVGTTQVSSQNQGVRSIGLEVNPIASFASKVKTMKFNKSEIVKLKNILNKIDGSLKKSNKIPKYKKLKDIFTSAQLSQILKIKGFYEKIDDEKFQDFFKLAYISIIEDCSNRIKDGNGIKISRTKKIIKNIIEYYVLKCELMIDDLEQKSHHSKSLIFHGSILQDNIYDKLKQYPIHSVIFSPPYANCFDYCEVSKMEIWLGDFVHEYRDFDKFREQAIRSHVNSKFDHTINNQNTKVDTIASLINTYNVWNKNIPDMIRGYFDDMEEVLKRISNLIGKGDYCYIVVANSSYKEIVVPTDLLLADIGVKLGFKVEKIIAARQMRSSSQQAPELKSQSLMRESVIILTKQKS
jgi:hypothetical protein